MAHDTPHRASRQSSAQQAQRQGLARQPGLPFADLLPATQVEAALPSDLSNWRQRLYTPVLTLWIFLSQILDEDHSCRQAVARFLAWLVSQGRPPCSARTGAYCQARKRLPEAALAQLTRQTGSNLQTQSPSGWRWHRRQARLVDGTTLSMPDTKANQQAYPQPRTQKPGLGFPILRVVVVFSLAVGTVLDAALNPYKGKETGETALLWALLDQCPAGEVLVGDRYFATYWLLAKAQQRGCDSVFRQHQKRKVDFRSGRRLGRDDHLITWHKPKRPAWMSADVWAALPDTLALRELRLRIPKGKSRTRTLVIVTTLLDASRYPKSEIQALYRRRWEAEIHMRAVKQTLQMDILRCKTPALVRKELWAHLLIYNLIRTVMARAAQAHQLEPGQLSFKGALQTLNAFGGVLPLAGAADTEAAYQAFLEAVASHRVGQRPDRYEPRKVKRRAKPIGWLTVPREEARARFAAGQ
jgi:hypothetical protein